MDFFSLTRLFDSRQIVSVRIRNLSLTTEGGVNRFSIMLCRPKHLLHAYLSVVRNVLLGGLEPDGGGLHGRGPRRGADVPGLVVVVVVPA